MRRLLPPHLLRRAGSRTAPTALLAVLLLSAGAAAGQTEAGSGVRGAVSPGVEGELARLVNAFRAENGLTTLQIDELLSRASRRHADNMAARDELSHVLDGRGPAERASAEGFPGPVAENVVAGDAGTARAFFDLWASSEPHRANVLGIAYGEMGVGCAHARGGRLYCAAMFGARR